MAADAADGMLAGRSFGIGDFPKGDQIGFVGGVGTGPIVRTTFVFGRGTAVRTRND
ncbi:hypothetical protein [Cohnella boryungensis]|uniref:Uncharacterized protein n=1 Tax=Cohnella boryungensis TaxID=768479 RepID=A0ABV8S974_9BACL